MTLGALIRRLEQERASQVVAHGFARPHSYRGFYDQLAFEPAENVTIGAMLTDAQSAAGCVYDGWKGGEFRMDVDTPVWLATRGDCGEEIGVRLLEFMLAGAEVRSHRAGENSAPWYEADGSTVMLPAEEVIRRRKLAAKVIAAARKVRDAERDLAFDAHGFLSVERWRVTFGLLCSALDALATPSPLSSAGENSATATDPGPMTWGLSTDEESFHGHYASKEEALANVETEVGPLEPGQRLWVGGGRLWRPSISVDADRLFEALAEHAGDECGEIAEDWLSGVSAKDSEALEAELHAVVLRWLERTGLMPKFYCCETVEEVPRVIPGGA